MRSDIFEVETLSFSDIMVMMIFLRFRPFGPYKMFASLAIKMQVPFPSRYRRACSCARGLTSHVYANCEVCSEAYFNVAYTAASPICDGVVFGSVSGFLLLGVFSPAPVLSLALEAQLVPAFLYLPLFVDVI